MPGLFLSLVIVGGFLVFLFARKNNKMSSIQDTTPPSDTKSSLDELIKSKFKLFQGLRTAEEDQKILDHVSELCMAETLKFISNNLNEVQKKTMEQEIEKSSIETEYTEVFTKYLTQIPDYQKKYSEMIEAYLSSISVKF